MGTESILLGGDGAVARFAIGDGALTIIAGPCVIESEDQTMAVAKALKVLCVERGLSLVFKASFDKANRTSGTSFRGPGLTEGLRILGDVRRQLGVPVTTDIHHPEHAAAVAEVVDLIQIPAFLCRQTDLLLAAGATGRPVNVKKGQFLAPWDMAPVIEKVRSGGAGGVMVTERGSSFGHNDLVVDFRGLATWRPWGSPSALMRPTALSVQDRRETPPEAIVRWRRCWRGLQSAQGRCCLSRGSPRPRSCPLGCGDAAVSRRRRRDTHAAGTASRRQSRSR